MHTPVYGHHPLCFRDVNICICTNSLTLTLNSEKDARYPGHKRVCFRDDAYCYCSNMKLLMSPQLPQSKSLSAEEVISESSVQSPPSAEQLIKYYKSEQLLTPEQIVQQFTSLQHRPSSSVSFSVQRANTSSVQQSSVTQQVQQRGQLGSGHPMMYSRQLQTAAQQPAQQNQGQHLVNQNQIHVVNQLMAQGNVAHRMIDPRHIQAQQSHGQTVVDPRHIHALAQKQEQHNLAVHPVDSKKAEMMAHQMAQCSPAQSTLGPRHALVIPQQQTSQNHMQHLANPMAAHSVSQQQPYGNPGQQMMAPGQPQAIAHQQLQEKLMQRIVNSNQNQIINQQIQSTPGQQRMDPRQAHTIVHQQRQMNPAFTAAMMGQPMHPVLMQQMIAQKQAQGMGLQHSQPNLQQPMAVSKTVQVTGQQDLQKLCSHTTNNARMSQQLPPGHRDTVNANAAEQTRNGLIEQLRQPN